MDDRQLVAYECSKCGRPPGAWVWTAEKPWTWEYDERDGRIVFDAVKQVGTIRVPIEVAEDWGYPRAWGSPLPGTHESDLDVYIGPAGPLLEGEHDIMAGRGGFNEYLKAAEWSRTHQSRR